MWFAIFTILPLAGIFYVGWHVWHLLPHNSTLRFAVMSIMLIALAALVANFSGALSRMPLRLAQVSYETGNSLLIILLYAVMLFILLDIATLVHVIPRKALEANGPLALGITLGMAALFTYGYVHYKDKARRELHLVTAKDTGTDRALKIVMLSDLHLGYHNRTAELARWIRLINAEKPDLVLISGDIIDNSVRPLIEGNMAAEFRKLKAPVYACPGNHEYYSGIDKAQNFFADAGIKLLCDSVVTFNSCVNIIGRDDRSNPRRKSVAELMRNVDKEKYNILLDHQPFHLGQSAKAGVDFQLSGHTHHGQVWPISWITEAVYEDACGYYRLGGTQYYVSSGMGIWGAKFRIGTNSEYVVATLRTTASE